MIRNALLLTLCVAFTGATWGNSSNGTNQVISVGIHDSGHALVKLSAASNTEGCARADLATTIVILNTNPNYKLMYATALAAMAMGKPVAGWVNGCFDLWGNGTIVPKATTLSVVN